MLFTAISLVVATAARAGEWVGSRFVPFASRALLAVGAASVALTPVLVPYVIASREVGLSRSLQETAEYAGGMDRLSRGRRPAALRLVEQPVLGKEMDCFPESWRCCSPSSRSPAGPSSPIDAH